MLSLTRRRALEIVRDNPGITPSEFAMLLWPDDPGHHRTSKCGTHGSSMGGGLRLAAGGFLGKLRTAGLVRRGGAELREFWLTRDGELALEAPDA